MSSIKDKKKDPKALIHFDLDIDYKDHRVEMGNGYTRPFLAVATYRSPDIVDSEKLSIDREGFPSVYWFTTISALMNAVVAGIGCAIVTHRILDHHYVSALVNSLGIFANAFLAYYNLRRFYRIMLGKAIWPR